MSEKMTVAEKLTLGGLGIAGVVVTIVAAMFGVIAATMIMDLFL